MTTPREELDQLRQEAAAAKPKLGKNDKAVQNNLSITPETLAADRAQDVSIDNIDELQREIDRTKDGPQRDVLIAEHNRIKAQAQGYDPAKRLAELEAKVARISALKKEGVVEKPKGPTFPYVPSGESHPAGPQGLADIGYDPSSLGITPAENIAGHPITRAIMGTPGVGLARAGAHFTGVGDEPFKEYDKLEATGRQALGSEGFDFAQASGGFAAPWGRYIPRTGAVKQSAALGAEGATAGFVAPGNKTDEDYVKGPLVGALLAGVPAGGAALNAAGRTADAMLPLPGRHGRMATRQQIAEIGQGNRGLIADALDQAPRLDTAAQATAHLPEGSPIAAAEERIASTPGGPSAEFGRHQIDQNNARSRVISTIVNSRVPARAQIGETLNTAIQGGPQAYLDAVANVDRSLLTTNQAAAIDRAAESAQRAVSALNPMQPTVLANGGGGQSVRLPPGTPASVRAVYSVAQAMAGAYNRPQVAAEIAQRHLNPSRFADAIRPRPPSSMQEIIDSILQRAPVGVMANQQPDQPEQGVR